MTIEKITDVQFIMKNRKKILADKTDNVDVPDNMKLGISTDKTILQRDLIKKKIMELKARINDGEDLQIQFAFGNPDIVKSRTRAITQKFPPKSPSTRSGHTP